MRQVEVIREQDRQDELEPLAVEAEGTFLSK